LQKIPAGRFRLNEDRNAEHDSLTPAPLRVRRPTCVSKPLALFQFTLQASSIFGSKFARFVQGDDLRLGQDAITNHKDAVLFGSDERPAKGNTELLQGLKGCLQPGGGRTVNGF